MKYRGILLLIIIDIILIIVFWVYTPSDAVVGETQPAQIEQNCQYPGRLYADGSCNNSDPCDPGTLKDPILQGDCRDSIPIVTIEETEVIEEYTRPTKSSDNLDSQCYK